ncbi:MAG: hypothetical protein NZM25_00600 [Leptospiraceae bacterium]|nr:hypothetical protein [Leptospiraceae bacterium]MDW8306224.1 hypothetical protein [Leptospiraceae bacterium]
MLLSLGLLALSSLGSLWLFSPSYAEKNETKDLTALLHRPEGFARYIIIPHLPELYAQARQNLIVEVLFKGKPLSQFFASPPPQLVSEVFRWLEILPMNLQKSLLGRVFSGSLLYVSTEKGAVLLLEVTPAGRLLLEKAAGLPKAFLGPYALIATSKELLDNQLQKLKGKPAKGLASLPVDKGELALVFDPDESMEKEERALSWAFYRTIFPRSRVGPQTFVVSFKPEGIFVRSRAHMRWNRTELEKSQFLSSLISPRFAQTQLSGGGVLLEFLADIPSLTSFMEDTALKKSTGRQVALFLNGFLVDQGRIFPDLAFLIDRKETKLISFLKEAFLYREAKVVRKESGEYQIVYPFSEFADPSYMAFNPHFGEEKDYFLWASTANAYGKGKEILTKAGKTGPIKQREERILVIQGNLIPILQSLIVALEKTQPFYAPAALGDFRDSIRELTRSIRKMDIDGKLLLNEEYLDGHFQLQL